MLINTKSQAFNMQEIKNRRFMFNPDTGMLILGEQEKQNEMVGSHEQEHADSQIKEPFDDFIRGWVGTGGQYRSGVVHFAPNIDKNAPQNLFNKAFDTVKMFWKNGANNMTVIRGFGEKWEQKLSHIVSPPSVLKCLEAAKKEIDGRSALYRNKEQDMIRGI